MSLFIRFLAACALLSLLAAFFGEPDRSPKRVQVSEPPPRSAADSAPLLLSAPSPTASPSDSVPPKTARQAPEAARAPSYETRWVSVQRLNVRRGPSTSAALVTALSSRTRFTVIDRRGGWVLLSLGNGSEGWVAERYTSTTPPGPRPVASREHVPQSTSARNVPNLDELKDEIIRRSIANYSGNCPCPYNSDRAGRRCGGRSAYSRPGGQTPICYRGDVTDAMLRRLQ